MDLATVASIFPDLEFLSVNLCYGFEGNLASLTNHTSLRVMEVASTQVEGNLASLTNLGLLTHLRLGGTQVEGSLASLTNHSLLDYLNLWGTQVEGNLASLANLGLLTNLSLWETQVEGSLASLNNLGLLTHLNLAGTQVEGTPSDALLARCKSSEMTCIFSPSPKMCGAGERIVGLSCEPCETCASEGRCLHGRDETSYFCDKCPPGAYKVGKECTECFAGSWTSLLHPILIFLGMVSLGTLLYLASVRIPALKSFLARFKLNLRNQVRLKQVSSLLQIMKVVSNLSLQFPSWFPSLFDLLAVATVPIALEPACVTWFELPTGPKGFSIFLAAMGTVAALRDLFRIPFLKRILPGTFFVHAQLAAGLLFVSCPVMVLDATFSSSELRTRIVSLGSSTDPDEAFEEAQSLLVDMIIQALLMIVEAALMVGMLDRWGTRYAEVEALCRDSNPSEREEMKEVDYQLQRRIPFYSSFSQNYVPAESNFEHVVFSVKVTCFLLVKLTSVASTVALMGEFHLCHNILFSSPCGVVVPQVDSSPPKYAPSPRYIFPKQF